MTAFRLNRPVSIVGPNFFGRPAQLDFIPGTSPEWLMAGRHKITPELITGSRRRLTIGGTRTRLEVAEHVLPPRCMGLQGVVLAGSAWPPYHGRTAEVWNALKPHVIEVPAVDRFYTTSYELAWVYPRKRGGKEAYVTITPETRSPKLTLDITCDYPGLGRRSRTFVLPDQAVFEEIFQARPLGHPAFLEWLARKRRWSHYDKVMWANREMVYNDVLAEIILHRAQDLLGALAFLYQDGMFVGRVRSVCAGHKADAEALKRAWRALTRVSF